MGIGEDEARQNEEERHTEPPIVQDVLDRLGNEARTRGESGPGVIVDDCKRREEAQARQRVQRGARKRRDRSALGAMSLHDVHRRALRSVSRAFSKGLLTACQPLN